MFYGYWKPPVGPAHRPYWASALEETFAAAVVAPPVALLTSTSLLANIDLLWRSEALGVQSGAVAAGSLVCGLLAALPLKLVHDTGHVGLLWREATPGPGLAAVLQAFVDASKEAQ